MDVDIVPLWQAGTKDHAIDIRPRNIVSEVEASNIGYVKNGSSMNFNDARSENDREDSVEGDEN